MSFPRLKHALLCRILVYVVVLGGFIAPIVIIANLNFVPEAIKVLVGIALGISLVVYLVRNVALLMTMDIGLATLHCHNTARERFVLPGRFAAWRVEKRILRFGKPYSPIAVSPTPHMLQYKSNASLTVYASGIERVIAVYHADFLDKSEYHSIINSALANSNALKGKKKHSSLDKSQKKSSLNRVTVVFIFAKQIEESFREHLFKKVCQNDGDGYDMATVPCVVDLETKFATFNCIRIPYAGFQYPVKNRGIRLVRKYLFDNRLTLRRSPDVLEPIKDMDPEQSLWSFWRAMKKEIILDERESRARYEKMTHKELVFEDGYIYLKWEERGLWLSVELDEETKIAEVDPIDSWYYPKSNKVAKETVKEVKGVISAYFADLGYSVKFLSYD